jgi:site-specific recombinase XerD
VNLQHLIEHYIDFQRALGADFRANANVLRAFGRAVGPGADVADVSTKQVDAFLAGAGPITRTWHVKLSVLRTFFRFAVTRGYVGAAPLPTAIPKGPPRTFTPYIYSQDELRRLFREASVQQGRRTCLTPITLHTILLTLYGAGLRLGEAINLNHADVDLNNSLLTIRRTKFGKTRLVPLGPMLREVLVRHIAPGQPQNAQAGQAPFFKTRTGARLTPDQVQHHFRRLCARVGIRRNDGGRFQPRLHDLRHSFAVHRLTSWYRRGADVQRLLPQLSTYLGHVEIADTQVYLSMTPELLNEASKRFERYVGTEGNHE